jgi:signal transduction histidine kinase
VDFVVSHAEMKQNICSMMIVPLKVENEVMGVLRLGSREKSFFDQHHLRLAELIADRAAVIVQNARLYDKVLKANRELERLNRVKTEFVSMVSHELRTPVTAIKGFVDVVMNEEAGPLNSQQIKFLKIAHNSIDRLTILISDLLDISRIEAGQMKLEMHPISMVKILQDSAETYRATIEGKKIGFHVKIAEKLPEVLADESRIKQVIDNLLSNAMKFTSPDGSIKLLVEDMGDFVLVNVSDTGVGIKKENQEKIFDRFFQVDSSLTRQVGGTGLGLAISKSIIEMHGGRIWVESEEGKGSTFRFLLPRLREKKPPAPQK